MKLFKRLIRNGFFLLAFPLSDRIPDLSTGFREGDIIHADLGIYVYGHGYASKFSHGVAVIRCAMGAFSHQT